MSALLVRGGATWGSAGGQEVTRPGRREAQVGGVLRVPAELEEWGPSVPGTVPGPEDSAVTLPSLGAHLGGGRGDLGFSR